MPALGASDWDQLLQQSEELAARVSCSTVPFHHGSAPLHIAKPFKGPQQAAARHLTVGMLLHQFHLINAMLNDSALKSNVLRAGQQGHPSSPERPSSGRAAFQESQS